MSDEVNANNLWNPQPGPTTVQARIAQFHSEMHMDMHQFHANWHNVNRDPIPPRNSMNQIIRTPNWGMDLSFGTGFLQMHHEMINAADNEPKQFLSHSSVMSWFRSKNYQIPGVWNPLSPIPNELAFNPTDGGPGRANNNPRFQLPSYFTVQGGTQEEPITGARRLADFRNVNQLGCCIVFPHNQWHTLIGGAMNSFSRAIDDPVFYFGVHRHVDEVYMNYRRLIRTNDFKHQNESEFDGKILSLEESDQIQTWEELGITLD